MMDLAGRWDLTIEEGSNFERYFRWEDSTGTAKDISGYTLRMNVRATYSSSTTLLTTEGETPTIVISKPGATGVFKIVVTSAVTTTLSFTRAVYDVEAYETTNVFRVIEGNVTLSREVTYA